MFSVDPVLHSRQQAKSCGDLFRSQVEHRHSMLSRDDQTGAGEDRFFAVDEKAEFVFEQDRTGIQIRLTQRAGSVHDLLTQNSRVGLTS